MPVPEISVKNDVIGSRLEASLPNTSSREIGTMQRKRRSMGHRGAVPSRAMPDWLVWMPRFNVKVFAESGFHVLAVFSGIHKPLVQHVVQTITVKASL